MEGSLHAHGDHTETGSLTISNLTLPLKKDFLARARRADGETFVNLGKSSKPITLNPWEAFNSLVKTPTKSKPKHTLGMVTTCACYC